MKRWHRAGRAIMFSLLLVVPVACAGDSPDVDDTESVGGETEDDADGDEDAATSDDERAGAISLDDVCAAGVDEGSFTYWATYEDENWQEVAAAFAEWAPGIDIEFLSLRDEETTQRILTSVSAGRSPEPDLISNDLASQAPLVERSLIDTEVDWTDLGVDEQLISGANSVRTYLVGLGLAYNTEATSPEDLPDTWEELIDDQYAGDVIVDPRGRPFGFFGLAWDEEQTLDYAHRLNDIVQPILIEGGTAGMTAVLTGEAIASTGGRADSALELQASGAPIDIKYLDLVPTEADYNALLADAASPNAAKCFAAWQATPEGAEVFESVEFKENLDSPRGSPAGATILLVETPEEAELTARLFQEVAAIFVQ
jgi:iron(III) transport system substrate-binding protein